MGWICLNGNIAVDAVLKMENLERDFEDVRWLLGGRLAGYLVATGNFIRIIRIIMTKRPEDYL